MFCQLIHRVFDYLILITISSWFIRKIQNHARCKMTTKIVKSGSKNHTELENFHEGMRKVQYCKQGWRVLLRIRSSHSERSSHITNKNVYRSVMFYGGYRHRLEPTTEMNAKLGKNNGMFMLRALMCTNKLNHVGEGIIEHGLIIS